MAPGRHRNFARTSFVALLVWALAAASNADERASSATNEDADLADYVVLAVKPSTDSDGYELVEVGDSAINEGRLRAVADTISRGFLGLGIGKRDFDENAEHAACRSACKADARCQNYAYTRPEEDRSIGVCRLRTSRLSFGVMKPIKDADDPAEPSVGETASPEVPATQIADDGATRGQLAFAESDARTTPIRFEFAAPVAAVSVSVRAAHATGQRTWAAVSAFGDNGTTVQTSGAWVSVDAELNRGHTILIKDTGNRIRTITIDAREKGALIVDQIEYTRAQSVTDALTTDAIRQLVDQIPAPPELPQSTIEPFPMPPRVIASAAPRDIITPPAPMTRRAAPKASPRAPARSVTPRERGLPVWIALGSIAVMFAGAALYWRNHRARTLKRLTTRLVTDGLDHRTVTLEQSEQADVSLRFVVRSPARHNTASPRINIVPEGASA